MSIVTEKYLVGIMGLILVGSVLATGYLDSERRKKENVPRASEAALPLSPRVAKRIEDLRPIQLCGLPWSGRQRWRTQFQRPVGTGSTPTEPRCRWLHQTRTDREDSKRRPIEPKLDPNGAAPPLHMPGYKDLLSDAQLNDLVAYLISLKPKGEESGF